MNLDLAHFDRPPRLGDCIVIRMPRPFKRQTMDGAIKWPIHTSVTFMVDCLEPLTGRPVEITRVESTPWGVGFIHSRKFCQANG